MAARALDLQLPLLDGFQPTNPTFFPQLPLDPTGLVARTLPTGPDEATPMSGSAYPPAGALHAEANPVVVGPQLRLRASTRCRSARRRSTGPRTRPRRPPGEGLRGRGRQAAVDSVGDGRAWAARQSLPAGRRRQRAGPEVPVPGHLRPVRVQDVRARLHPGSAAAGGAVPHARGQLRGSGLDDVCVAGSRTHICADFCRGLCNQRDGRLAVHPACRRMWPLLSVPTHSL